MSNLKGIYRTDCAEEPNLKVIKSNIISCVYFEKGLEAVVALKSLIVFESVFCDIGLVLICVVL